MKLATWSRIVAVTAITLGLTACGGGGSDTSTVTEEVPVQTTTPAAQEVVADLKLVQVPMVTTVTPGETTTIARMKTDCLVYEQSDVCKVQVSLGESVLGFDIDLADLKLFQNGQEIAIYFNKETSPDGKKNYRIMPAQILSVWQKNSIFEIVATISPYEKTGTTTATTVRFANASLDKTFEVVPTDSRVSVLALPHLAPVVISNISKSSVNNNGIFGEVASFDVTCPATNTQGCSLSSFDFFAFNAIGGSEVNIHIDEYWYAQYFASGTGNDFFNFSANYRMHPGQMVRIKISTAIVNGSVSIFNVKTLSGNTVIAPQIDNTVSNMCDKIINTGNCGEKG